jgi:hypothetical protein
MREIFYMLAAAGGISTVSRAPCWIAFKTKPPGSDRAAVHEACEEGNSTVLGRPGSDLLFRVLGRSTIGSEAFNDRVRDGIGFGHLDIATRPAKDSDQNETGFFQRANSSARPRVGRMAAPRSRLQSKLVSRFR